jgi:small subunit ribosomal protein S4
VIFRMSFVPTMPAARQFINHGHVRVNGKRVNIPSYLVREGDEIEVSEKAHHMPLLLETVQNKERDVPDYLSVDFNKYKGTYVRVPKMSDVPYPVRMEPNLVVEFYSR